jgi:hypothetical protein
MKITYRIKKDLTTEKSCATLTAFRERTTYMTTAQDDMLDRHVLWRLCMQALNEPLTEETMPGSDPFYETARDICRPPRTIRIEDIFGNRVTPKRDQVADLMTCILEIEAHLCAAHEAMEQGVRNGFPSAPILRLARRDIIEVARELLGAAQEIAAS